MKRLTRHAAIFAVALVIGLVTPVAAQSANATPAKGEVSQQTATRPVVRDATRTDTSTKPLRAYPGMPPVLGRVFEAKPAKLLPNRAGSSGPAGPDPVLQESAPAPAATLGGSFEGVGNVDAVLPPDPVGDIGPNHYVQMVNLSFAVYDRNGNRLVGPFDNNTLFDGFGGPCETTNSGDPIVLYDELSDRWMLSQFALPNFPRGPFYQCIAVSQGSDPTGTYHRYEFLISDTKLNDYPKFGVWPDGYYMAINQFTCNFANCSWAGQGVVAFERDKMLLGQSARMVYFDLDNLDPNLGGMLPSDLDGPLPPAGAPNPFSLVDDDAWGYSPDQLQVWQFDANWTDPTTSTFSHAGNLGVAAFDSNMCGYSRNCIPQPGGTKLDAISDRLMYRLQYRNFGGHETLVTNHTVDVNGADRAGVRWYELRNSGTGWSIHQQGTFSPDGNHRWMASVAMNKTGDIGLGYSVSSTSVYPSVRATGRLDGETLGAMTQGELTIVDGSGYQEHSSGRWGDYSMMAVDPVDDCTFWYTAEYYAVVGSAPWQTRIGSFKLRDCGPVNSAPTVTIDIPADGSKVAGDVTIQIGATDTETAAGALTVEWNIDGGAWQPTTFNSATGKYEALWSTTGVADGSHTVNAQATDGGGNVGKDSNTVTVDNVNDPPLASFIHSCAGLTCTFDGTSSTDDRGINSYSWDFGDGTTGSGVTASRTYAAAGTYTVILTVTDTDGATGSTSKSVTVANSMHVGDLDRSSINNGNSWTAQVTISVHTSGHATVSSATVIGSWGNGGTSTCTTGSTGTCIVSKSGIPKRTSSVTFTVTGVTHGTLTYDATGNHDPDGDSDGTSITVLKP